MGKKEEMYFKNIDSNFCYPLGHHIDNAKCEGLEEITLVEAIPDKEPYFVWCTNEGDTVSRSDCRKSECESYKANKSGRGTCIHRGKLYRYGGVITIKLNK